MRRREARRGEILRAAARIFRERGVDGAGMREIAHAADLSPANLYHYFRGKDEILFYCQDRALDRMLAAVAEARRTTPAAADRLQRVLAAHLRTLLDDVEGATAHLQLDSLSPALRKRIVLKRDRYERALRGLIEAGVATGELTAGDPALVARAMLGALNWTVTWFDREGAASADVIGDLMARFLVRGVAVSTPAVARSPKRGGPGPGSIAPGVRRSG
jgi:AcrR family transcriptional regulator